MINDNNIEDWYRKETSRFQEDPGQEIWNKLSDQLDVENVWDRLNGSLDKRDRLVYWTRNASLALSLLLLLGGIGFGLMYQKSKPVESEVSVHDLNSIETTEGTAVISSVNISNNWSNDLSSKTSLGQELSKKEIEEAIIKNNLEQPEYKYIAEVNPQLKQEVFAQETNNALDLNLLKAINLAPGLIETRYSVSFIPPLIAAEKNQKKKKESRSFYLGGIVAVKNQWLLTHDTYSSFKKDELNYSELDYGKSIGLNFGYSLSSKLDLETNLFLFSEGGQEYVDYIEGKSIERSLDLDYYKATFLLKFKKVKDNEFSFFKSSNFLFGIYGGYMKSAEMAIDGGLSLDVRTEYKDLDYGAIIGYELNYPINKKLLLTPGIRLQQGVSNIFMGNITTPVFLNKTYNTAIEFTVSLNYSL